ncbi:MAG: hypothetical protein SFU83_10195, partial [Meiothermus sp.]|nr:hypothetical protein [Meiothermus sp.]
AEEGRWLEAYRAHVIKLTQLDAYKRDIEARRAELLRQARPGPGSSSRVREEAYTLPLRHLLQLASVQVVATREHVSVTVFAD